MVDKKKEKEETMVISKVYDAICKDCDGIIRKDTAYDEIKSNLKKKGQSEQEASEGAGKILSASKKDKKPKEGEKPAEGKTETKLTKEVVKSILDRSFKIVVPVGKDWKQGLRENIEKVVPEVVGNYNIDIAGSPWSPNMIFRSIKHDTPYTQDIQRKITKSLEKPASKFK